MDGIAFFGYDSSITNCSFSGTITAYSAGGILYISSGNTVSRCYNSATITAIEKDAGGIIGIIGGESGEDNISDCYNAGTISATESIENSGISGGIVGYAVQKSEGNVSVKISNTYNRGTISGTFGNGEIIGAYNLESYMGNSLEIKITNCYCNTPSSSIGHKSGNPTIKGTAEQLTQNSVLGENWKADTNNINGGYPILNWQ